MVVHWVDVMVVLSAVEKEIVMAVNLDVRLVLYLVELMAVW